MMSGGAEEVPILCFCCIFNLWGMNVQIGGNELGRKRVGGVEGEVVVVVTGVAEGEGGQKEQLVVGRAVSWQGLS